MVSLQSRAKEDVGVLAAHLAPCVLLFLLAILCVLPQQSQSPWTCDWQTLLHILTVVSSLSAAGQRHFSPGLQDRYQLRYLDQRNDEGNVDVEWVFQLKQGEPGLLCALPRLFLPKLFYLKRGLNLDNLCYMREDADHRGTCA